jgi:hypothetical protein
MLLFMFFAVHSATTKIKDGGCSMEPTWNYPPTHAGMEGALFNPFAGVDLIRSSIGSCGLTHQRFDTSARIDMLAEGGRMSAVTN